jgi:hypothetical protein
MTELRLQSSRVDWREVDGELIALARAESVYLAGNASAAVLWRALAAGTTDADLEALLVSTYGISAEAARADVAAFLADLGARGLLEAASRSPGAPRRMVGERRAHACETRARAARARRDPPRAPATPAGDG